MFRRLQRLLVCVLAFAAAAVASAAPAGTPAMGVLESGLRIVTDSRDAGSGGATAVWVVSHRGAADQRGTERGAAMIAMRALMHELVDRGVDVAGLFGMPEDDVLGGDGVGLFTQHGVVMMRAEDGRALEAAMGVARVMLGGFVPSEAQIERARGSVLADAVERRDDSYERHVRADWMVELFDGGPLSRLSVARPGDIESVSDARVRSYIERCWRPDTATVVVVGREAHAGVLAAAGRTLGGLDAPLGAGNREPVLDTRDVSGRVVTRASERLETGTQAMVWFDPGAGAAEDETLMRARLAVAGEAARARVDARVRQRLGDGVIDAGAQFGMIAHDVSYAQLIVRLRSGAWDTSLGVLSDAAESLRVNGVRAGEVERAREIVRREWTNQRTYFESGDHETRARLWSFFVAEGGPLVDPGDWIGGLIGRLGGVSVDEVNGVIAAMLSVHEPGVVVLEPGARAPDPALASGIVTSAGERLAEGDQGGGSMPGVDSVLDVSPNGGSPREIRIHQRSGVVSCRLENDAWAHHKTLRDEDRPGRARISVHVGFGGADPQVMNGAAGPVLEAMRDARLTRRLDDEVRAFSEAHGIEHSVELDARGLTVHVEADTASLDQAATFAYALLTDVRLDGEPGRSVPVVGAMELGVAEALGTLEGDREPRVSSLRWWIGRIRGSAIEIGVSGDVGAERSLSVVAGAFGALPNEPGLGSDDDEDESLGGRREPAVRVPALDGPPGVAVGFTGCAVGEVEETRALVLGGLVLGERLMATGVGEHAYASAIVFPSVGDRAVVVARVECGADEADRVSAAVSSQIDQCADLAMTDDEVERARSKVLALLDSTMPEYGFWSSRLARLRASRQSIDDLWSIRETYAALTSERVNDVYRRWHGEGTRFEVRIVDD